MEDAKTKGLPDSEYDALKKTVAERVRWQKDHVKDFEDSVPNPNSAARLMALPALLVLLFGLVRWNA